MNWLKDLDQNLLLNTWDTHSGQYKCIASNLYSSDERVAWLLPQPTKRTSAQILREIFKFYISFISLVSVWSVYNHFLDPFCFLKHQNKDAVKYD